QTSSPGARTRSAGANLLHCLTRPVLRFLSVVPRLTMTRTLLVLPWLLLVVSLTLAADEKKDEDKPTVKLSDDEKMILELANKERGKNKTPALKLNKILCEVARKPTENMAKKNKVAHILDGKTPAQRVTAAGYRYTSVGENLAWIEGDEDCKPPTP